MANERIWTGVPIEGQTKFTFWHVLFFAWFCNRAMHGGMADMTILRYAKKWQHGFFSALGLYLGHYVAWIAAGILRAASHGVIAPGPIAYLGGGVAGVLAAVIFTDVWLLLRFGLRPDYAQWRQLLASWPAGASWGFTLLACRAINMAWGSRSSFSDCRAGSPPAPPTSASASCSSKSNVCPPRTACPRKSMNRILRILSCLGLGLGLTVVPAVLVFAGMLTWEAHAALMLAGAVLWFATAPFWMRKKSSLS